MFFVGINKHMDGYIKYLTSKLEMWKKWFRKILESDNENFLKTP